MYLLVQSSLKIKLVYSASDLIVKWYKLRRVKGSTNFIASWTKIVKRLRCRQYYPGIIEKTIGLALCSSTAIYRLVLKHCTLTIKVVGITWRAVQTSAEATRPLALSPLIFNRDSYSPLTLAGVQTARSIPGSCGRHLIFWNNNQQQYYCV